MGAEPTQTNGDWSLWKQTKQDEEKGMRSCSEWRRGRHLAAIWKCVNQAEQTATMWCCWSCQDASSLHAPWCNAEQQFCFKGPVGRTLTVFCTNWRSAWRKNFSWDPIWAAFPVERLTWIRAAAHRNNPDASQTAAERSGSRSSSIPGLMWAGL